MGPRESLSMPPAHRGGHRSPFFRGRLRGLLCWAGVEPPRGRGRPSGAGELQLFFGHVVNENIFEDPNYYDVTGGFYNKRWPQGSREKAPGCRPSIVDTAAERRLASTFGNRSPVFWGQTTCK